MLAAIRHVALKHGFNVKSMESYAHTDGLNRTYKQYIVPPALCELVIKYARDLHQRRARCCLPGRVPVSRSTQVFTLADEVVATLNRAPSETLRLSRIAIQFSCTEAEAAKKLAAAVKQGRIKCAGTIYAASTYKFEQNLTQLSPAEREYRVLNPTRSYSGFAIESKSSRQDSLDKQLQIRPGTPWALKTTHSLQK